VSRIAEDSLKLQAAIEFGSEYTYEIKNGGHGPTLVIEASSKTSAAIARKKAPSRWEDFYVLVVYSTSAPEEEPSGSSSIV
tara:strand:+ start:2363 stop:2605 length:243 start_codon:yes stop_codon:yes gene_type:complete